MQDRLTKREDRSNGNPSDFFFIWSCWRATIPIQKNSFRYAQAVIGITLCAKARFRMNLLSRQKVDLEPQFSHAEWSRQLNSSLL